MATSPVTNASRSNTARTRNVAGVAVDAVRHGFGPTRPVSRPPSRSAMKEREMSGPITQPGIVVGVDGSPASNAAAGWAARNA